MMIKEQVQKYKL